MLMMMAIVIFVADASIPISRRHKREASDIGEIARQAEQKESKDNIQEQITYNGAQVWRIHKPDENSSYVNELVQHYDEDGCM